MVTVLNVVLQNHPGSLAEVLEIMARAEINVDAIEAEAQGDFGTVRLLTSKPKLAGELLRQDGYEVVEAEALQLMLPNKYGELARLAKKLADSNVNVVSLFGTSPNGPNDGRLVLRVN
ncbi:MAG TPA: ACT domain-containing protein, partial [Candidatus Thermoplasmatota archaeon]|nr:ACT domain-containing protein [Candidatus Thermoplasmatota archaeon]